MLFINNTLEKYEEVHRRKYYLQERLTYRIKWVGYLLTQEEKEFQKKVIVSSRGSNPKSR